MYSVFVVLHKVKYIIPSKSPIYFECTLNNEKLTSEPMVATSEMTVDTELVFYLNEQQFNFLKQNRLNCKLSCYQKPKKLIGFVLLDLRRSESQLPPINKKWFTLMNTSYTPRPQLLVGFGVGLVPDQPNEFQNLDELSPERLIAQALQSWSPNVHLNLHQGNIVIGNGKSVYRMTATISAHAATTNESIAIKILNKSIILNSNKPTSIHQIVFEGHLSDLIKYWQSATFKIFHVQHLATKPIKKKEREFVLVDFLNGSLNKVEMDPFLINLECIGFPGEELKDLANSQKRVPVHKEQHSVETPLYTEPEYNASQHQYRLSIDLRSFMPRAVLKSPISVEYHFPLLNHNHQFATHPPIHTTNKMEAWFTNGFCAYEFVTSNVKQLLDSPLILQIYLNEEYKTKELIGSGSVAIGNVLNATKTPEIHGMGDLQLIDHMVTVENVGDIKCTVALEDFGVADEAEEKLEIQEKVQEVTEREPEPKNAKDLEKEKIKEPETPRQTRKATRSPSPVNKSKIAPVVPPVPVASSIPIPTFNRPQTAPVTQTSQQTQHNTMVKQTTGQQTLKEPVKPVDYRNDDAYKKQLDHLFTGYKQAETLINNADDIKQQLHDQIADLQLQTKKLEAKETKLKSLELEFIKTKEQEGNRLKQQYELDLKRVEMEMELYKNKAKDSHSKYLEINKLLKSSELQVLQGQESLIALKQGFAGTNTHLLQQENHSLKEEKVVLTNKLLKSEQAKSFYKDKCKQVQMSFDTYKKHAEEEQNSKMTKDVKMVENMKWRYLLQEEEKKNLRDMDALKGLQEDLRGIGNNGKKANGGNIGGEEGRLIYEKQELLRTGLYFHTDPVILQIDEKLRQLRA